MLVPDDAVLYRCSVVIMSLGILIEIEVAHYLSGTCLHPHTQGVHGREKVNVESLESNSQVLRSMLFQILYLQ